MKPYIHKLHSVVHADTCEPGASYSEYVYLSEYEELAAKLQVAYDTLDYFGHSPPYDGSQAKAQAARIAALEAQSIAKDERIAKLEAALHAEAAALRHASRGQTHWDGCHHEHQRCAALMRIDAALK